MKDLYDKPVELTYDPKYWAHAITLIPFFTSEQQKRLAELLEFYSIKRHGFPHIKFSKFSQVMFSAYFSLEKNGYIVGTIRGSVGWDWYWLNSNVTDSTPKTVTLNALGRANAFHQVMLSSMFCKNPVKLKENERLFTHDWKLHT